MYEYTAQVLAVVDGDTLDLRIDLGLRVYHVIRCRLNGINTPELNSKDELVRKKAQQAKDYVSSRVTNKIVTVKTIKDKTEKYGRYLVDVYYDDMGKTGHLNAELIDAGLATKYDGQGLARDS
jgi:micrococcal nuclease